MKYFLSFLISCTLYIPLTAQLLTPHKLRSGWQIKTTPLSFLEPDQCVSIAAEYITPSEWGIQLESSYIFNTMSITNEREILKTSGFRLAPEIRYYGIGEHRLNTISYFGFQASYK